MNAITTTGNNAMTPTSMESAIKLAEMMARGKLVPAHLHNSPGDCLMVVEQALRWAMSPFAVAQCTSVIQGKLMFEGKLVAAALNASGVLSSRLDYVFTGAGNDRAVTVRGTLKGETKAREVTVYLAEAKTSNGMWIKQPDQQLVYAGTRVWARRHAPEVMLGVYAPEEFDQAAPFTGPTLDAEPDEAPPAPIRAAAAAIPREERIARLAPTYDTPLPEREPIAKSPPARTDAQWQDWLGKLRLACAQAETREAVEEQGGRPSVADALKTGPQWVQDEITAALADGVARFDASTVMAELETDWPGPAPA
jgi:hypothetical protein